MRISDWSSDVCSSDLFVLALVDAQCRLRHALDLRDDRLALEILQSQGDGLLRAIGNDVEVGDVAFVLEDGGDRFLDLRRRRRHLLFAGGLRVANRSEEHTSELQSLMRISYAVFCLKKKQYSKRMH